MSKMLKKDQLVMLTTEVTSCGCSQAEVGTIGKVAKDQDSKSDVVNILFCNDGCITPVEEEYCTALNEKSSKALSKLFDKASEYKYATIF